MANGSTAHTTVEAVKASCRSLETSPSCHSESSNVYASGGHTTPPAKHSGAGKTHSGKRGTKETPEKLGAAHNKRGH